jgi:hypothetical protein
MINRGQATAIMEHDAACVNLMRLWSDETPLPEHLEVWAVDYLQRIETTVTRRQDPTLVRTHPTVRDFISATTNALLIESYHLIEHKIHRATDMMQEDGFGDEEAWAEATFKELNYFSTSLMGWVRMTSVYLEDPRDTEALELKNLKVLYSSLAEGYSSQLNLFLRELRTQPVSCRALLDQAAGRKIRPPLPVEDFESLWGWHKGLLRIRTLAVVPA